jgi:hypothetical protein
MMNRDRLRALVKKLAPFAVGAAVVGTGVGIAAQKYFGDCCRPGASCCYPGSPCCHGHAHADGVAAR